MAGWLTITTSPTSNLGVASTGNNKADGTPLWLINFSAAGKLQLYHGAGYQVTDSAALTTNTWHHVAYTWNSSTHLVSFYKDGVLLGSATAADSNYDNTNFYLGSGYNGTLPGSLAEWTVWSVDLTANEVAALALGGRPHRVRPASLTGYWPLWGLTSPEPDLSGNANNGTLTGTAFATHAPLTPFTKKTRSQVEPAASAGSVLIPRLLVALPQPSPALFE